MENREIVGMIINVGCGDGHALYLWLKKGDGNGTINYTVTFFVEHANPWKVRESILI